MLFLVSPGALTRPRERRSAAGRVVLALGLAAMIMGALSLSTGRAQAAMSCRSDPVIVVNGTVSDVVSTLWTDPGNIHELDYVVTVPAGSLIGKLTLTAGLGFPEKVTYVYSWTQPWGSMRIDATVQTQGQVAPFQTSVRVSTLLGGVHTAYGTSDSTVSLTVSHTLMLL